jgi:restriction system protein
METDEALPTTRQLLALTVHALRSHGTMRNDAIEEAIVELLGLSPQLRARRHKDGRTEIGYRAAWARTELRKRGLIAPPSRGEWRLTPSGEDAAKAPDALKILATLEKQSHSKGQTFE